MSKIPLPPSSNLPGHLVPGHLDKLLGYQIALASIPTSTLFKKYISQPFSLNKVEFTILMLVAANTTVVNATTEVTSKQLCSAINIPASNMTLLLDRLESRKLLMRSQSERDRRVTQLHLTTEGSKLVKKLRLVVDTMEAELLKYLTPAESAMLYELLRKISSHRRV